MILLVLLWLRSNEDLLNIGFHELLMIDLLIQPILLELEASIPSCVIDTSRSISFPATHTILSMYTFESLCLDTEIHTPSTTGTSTTQSRTALVEQHPLSSEPSRLLELGFMSSTFGSSYELQTIWTDFCSMSCATFVHARTRQFGLIASQIENQPLQIMHAQPTFQSSCFEVRETSTFRSTVR